MIMDKTSWTYSTHQWLSTKYKGALTSNEYVQGNREGRLPPLGIPNFTSPSLGKHHFLIVLIFFYLKELMKLYLYKKILVYTFRENMYLKTSLFINMNNMILFWKWWFVDITANIGNTVRLPCKVDKLQVFIFFVIKAKKAYIWLSRAMFWFLFLSLSLFISLTSFLLYIVCSASV